MKEQQVIYLDKAICRSCTHLVGELGTKTKSCTAKKGNTKCPAQFYKIEVGVDTEKAIEDFYLALQQGDINALVAAVTAAQANPKLSVAVITDLQERLFDLSSDSEDEEDSELDALLEEAENMDGEEEDLEDEDDEDADA